MERMDNNYILARLKPGLKKQILEPRVSRPSLKSVIALYWHQAHHSLPLQISISLIGSSYHQLQVLSQVLKRMAMYTITIPLVICAVPLLVCSNLIQRLLKPSRKQYQEVELTKSTDQPENYLTLPDHITVWIPSDGQRKYSIFGGN